MAIADEKFEAKKGFWESLKKIVKDHPKGKPLDKDGKFYPDPTPVAPPVGQSHVAEIDMFEVMKNRIRNEASIAAMMAGEETFEEADDFEVYDDPEPFSPWEEIVDQPRPDGPVVHRDAPQPPEKAPEGVASPPTAPEPSPKK